MKVKHGKVKEIAHVYTAGKEERARTHPPDVWLQALHIKPLLYAVSHIMLSSHKE